MPNSAAYSTTTDSTFKAEFMLLDELPQPEKS
jgi:hypothetical protein